MFPRVNYSCHTTSMTDHEDVDAFPTSLKNMSGQIVCTIFNIFPPQVMSARSQVIYGLLHLLLLTLILHRMMMMTVRQVEILQNGFKIM